VKEKELHRTGGVQKMWTLDNSSIYGLIVPYEERTRIIKVKPV
jgi:hypothetical protein